MLYQLIQKRNNISLNKIGLRLIFFLNRSAHVDREQVKEKINNKPTNILKIYIYYLDYLFVKLDELVVPEILIYSNLYRLTYCLEYESRCTKKSNLLSKRFYGVVRCLLLYKYKLRSLKYRPRK